MSTTSPIQKGPGIQQELYSDPKVLSKLNERAKVVCQIMLKNGVGTAFLIGRDLIMTNHHVLATPKIAREAKAVFFHLEDSQDRVAVDLDPEQFFYTSPTPDRLGFKPITKTNLDFTIVSIKPHPKITAISYIAFSIFNASKPQEGSYANIIHHPYLESDHSSYQKVSFRDNTVNQVTQFILHYTTCTNPGSSGSPVMDDAGNLIALHRATCTELLQVLLKALGPLLEELFPQIPFTEQELILENPQGKFFGICAPINGSPLYIFSEGELKGMYYHQGVMQLPASLFRLIQTQHNPPKEWALEFLKKQNITVSDYHRECNTAVRISTIHQHLQEVNLLGQIQEKYEATQKTIYSLLKESYLRGLASLPLVLTNEAFPIKSFFTQLALVSSASQEKKEKETQKKEEEARNPHLIEKDSLREIYARLHTPEEPLEIDTLFNDRSSKPVTKVLVLGRAGIGKSTLCQKIAYEWASETLFKEKFAAVYHLKLRELNTWMQEKQNSFKENQDPDQWLSGVISLLCYQGNYPEKIFQELQRHPDKILLILDGWDEASPALIKAIKNCLRQTNGKHYLLTSRPGVTTDIHNNFDLIVENMGFTHQQVEIYAEKYFTHTKSPELKSFLNNLRSQSDLFTIAHIPIQLQILCALWRKGEKEFPQTLTTMFSKVIDHLFEWEQSKRKGVKEISLQKKPLLYQALGEIALKGLENKQLIVPKSLIEGVLKDKKKCTQKDLIETGLIKGCGESGEMYFIHLTYQEYSIAKLISNLPLEEQRAFIQGYRYKPQFHLVIRMLAGSIWEKTKDLKALELFFEWLYSGPVDLIGSYQIELALACLGECRGAAFDESIWIKYKIADFVDYVSEHEATRDCLSRLMALSRRAFLQVIEKLQNKETHQELLEWFLRNLSQFIKKEYISDAFFDFIKRALSDEDSDVRRAAVVALGKIAAHVEEKNIPQFLDCLQNALSDKKSYVRGAAALALGNIAAHVGEKNIPQILHCLQTALSDQESGVRMAAAGALENIAPHVGEKNIPQFLDWLRTALSDEDSDARRAAAKALGNIAPHVGEKNIPQILDCLQTALSDKEFYVRRAAAGALGNIAAHVGEKNIPQILDCLQTALSDKDSFVRRGATGALGNIAAHVGEKNIPQILGCLQTALSDKDSDVRGAATGALGNIAAHVGEKNIPQFLDCLQTALSDKDSDVRGAAVVALGKIAAHVGEKNIPQILDWFQTALSDKDSYVRRGAAGALGKIAAHVGEKNIPQILDWLQTALCDKDRYVRTDAARALGNIAAHVGEKNIPQILGWLQTALSDKDSDVRGAAAGALGKIAAHVGEKNIPQILDWLQTALCDKDRYVRRAALEALGNIAAHVGEKNIPQFLGCLQTALSDKESDVRRAALEALGNIAAHVGEKNIPQFLGCLQTALSDKDSYVREATVKTIKNARMSLLITIFVSKSARSPITSLIYQHFINQATPLCLIQKGKNDYLIQAIETEPQKINQNQKVLLERRIHGKGIGQNSKWEDFWS